MSIESLNSPSLLGYLWRARRALAPGVGLALLRSLAIAPCPLIFARIIDQSVPAGDTRSVLLYTALFAALLGMHYVFSILGANELAKVMARLMVELRSRIFFRLQFLSFSSAVYSMMAIRRSRSPPMPLLCDISVAADRGGMLLLLSVLSERLPSVC